MKKTLLFICLSILFFSCNRAEKKNYTTINFTHGSFKEVLAKAKQEQKLIFVDCYTSWCAPCKWMEKNVFVLEPVYRFYNESFVNYGIDMEKGEGPELAKKYNVTSFPTYLFLNGDGELVHLAKSKMEAEAFINVGRQALDPETAFGNLSRNYAAGGLNKDQLAEYAIQLNKMRDPKSEEVLSKLLDQADEEWLKSEQGWKLMQSFVRDDQSELFGFLDKNKTYYTQTFGKDAVDELYRRVVQRNMYAYSRNKDEKNFFILLDSLKALNATGRDLAIPHCQFYLNQDDAENFKVTSNYYLKSYLQDDAMTIAFIARSAFNNHSENPEIVKQAAHLIEIAYEMQPDVYGIVGTYAEIMGHSGQKDKALAAAQRAVKIADTISSKIKKIAEKNLKELQKLN